MQVAPRGCRHHNTILRAAARRSAPSTSHHRQIRGPHQGRRVDAQAPDAARRVGDVKQIAGGDAERLGLPFSTYRYQLAQGLERLAAWLWQRELYGDEN